MCDKNPVEKEVQSFDKKCLKKTHTNEKNQLPTQEDIKAEKEGCKDQHHHSHKK